MTKQLQVRKNEEAERWPAFGGQFGIHTLTN